VRLAVGHCKHFGHVVDIAGAASAKIDRAGAKGAALFRGSGQMSEPLSEREINQLLEFHLPPAADPFQRGGHIIFQRDRSSHASKHKIFDALMQEGERSNDVGMGAENRPL